LSKARSKTTETKLTSRQRFSIQEDCTILKTILKTGKFDPTKLAKELGRRYSSIQRRWQYHLVQELKSKDPDSPLWGTSRENEILGIVLHERIQELEIRLKTKGNSIATPLKLFSPEDDQTLLENVEELGMDWSLIAEDMPGRSPEELCRRYLNHVNPKLVPASTPFTQEEDDLIREFVEKRKLEPQKKGKTSMTGIWQHLSIHVIPRRSPLQLRDRWYTVLDQQWDSNPFSMDEWEALNHGLKVHGLDFAKIKDSVPLFSKRRPVFLKNQWMNAMERGQTIFSTLNWTPKLDQKLLDLTHTKGQYCWKEIQKQYFQKEVQHPVELRARFKYLMTKTPWLNFREPSVPMDEQIEKILKNNPKISMKKLKEALKDIPSSLLTWRMDRRERDVFRQAHEWTPAELEKLQQLANDHSTTSASQDSSQKIINWKKVSQEMERPKRSCIEQWTRLSCTGQ
jgi:hypothetical protein